MTLTSPSNVLDFNSPVSTCVNAVSTPRSMPRHRRRARKARRDYLVLSSIGSECLRKGWQFRLAAGVCSCAARTKRIFNRGHVSEEKIAARLMQRPV